ncbi:solute carrier family 26 [Seminavis robusta]|uniref:Solute carrier family 26 n=1 Tax=Seminavis robusta TaxID=568900 RepID=A0A9N8DHZ8_9STRA|nr:solute carrier family 26 [Seminavis robusta]|eukprot:Sro100_g051100.1 solute carrier family 26 (501) ;mRNA; r:7640-9474
MADSFGNSPRWRGLKDRQVQRREDVENELNGSYHQRRNRGSYIAPQNETDYLLSTFSDTAPATPASPPPGMAPGHADGRQSPFSGSLRGKSALVSMLDASLRRGASSVVDVRDQAEKIKNFLAELPNLDKDGGDHRRHSATINVASSSAYGSCEKNEDVEGEKLFQNLKDQKPSCKKTPADQQASLITQIPAIAIASLLNLMMAIPFGVSYFPIGWSAGGENNAGDAQQDADGVSGAFPLPGKEALGIRMCLFSTLVGQLVMTFASKFDSCICFQMIENVPFFHTLARVVIASQGYGIESLSTLFFLFGLSSALVGILFYLLGRFNLGSVVYFFPNHVLVGCIGGIGVFITISALEVTNDASFSWDMQGLQGIIDNFHLLSVVLLFEATLRLLIWKTKSRIPLLSPIFFCSIPFAFYAGLWVFRVDMEDAMEAGYFFPAPAGEDGNQSLFDRAFSSHTLDLLHVVDFTTISWEAVLNSSGTMVALAAFSLIHVPINIPGA